MLEGGGLQSIEINKLQNEIRVRDRELEASRRELTTLKSTVASNERCEKICPFLRLLKATQQLLLCLLVLIVQTTLQR